MGHEDNYLSLESFNRLTAFGKLSNTNLLLNASTNSGLANPSSTTGGSGGGLLLEPPGLPARRHSSHQTGSTPSTDRHHHHLHTGHPHQRHHSFQLQNSLHVDGGDLMMADGLLGGHHIHGLGASSHHHLAPPPHHIQPDIHIEQHPSLEGFPPHHVNGYKLLESSYPPPIDGSHVIRVAKCSPSLGMVIEGGVNTEQPLPRIISIQTEGAAFQAGGLKIGQLISYVDGCPLSGLSHEAVAHLIAECFAKRDPPFLTLVVVEHRPTGAEMRRSCMLPQ